MSKSNFKRQMHNRARLSQEAPTKKHTYICPTMDQLFSFAGIYLQSVMGMQLTDIQKAILKESFTDPEVIEMWKLRHFQFQASTWTTE